MSNPSPLSTPDPGVADVLRSAAASPFDRSVSLQTDDLVKPSLSHPDPSSSEALDEESLSHSHSHSHAHVHSEESLKRIVNRLSRLEGHIRGIKTMVQDSRACPDVLIQLAAVRGAIDRVARLVLDEHLTECVARAAKEGNIEAEIEELKAAIDRFLP